MEGDRPLQVRGSLPAVEDTLCGNRDVVGVVNLVVNKVSIDTAVKRWAPVVCVVRFIYSGCWSNASSVDNLNAAVNVGCMAPWECLHSRNQLFVVCVRSGWCLPFVEDHLSKREYWFSLQFEVVSNESVAASRSNSIRCVPTSAFV